MVPASKATLSETRHAAARAAAAGRRAGYRRGVSDALLRRLTGAAVIANLVGQVLIVVTGGAVRLTGSGLGCSTWPQCEPGSFTPVFHEAMGMHVFVEFGNRMIGVLLGLVGIALAVLTTLAVRRLGRSEDVSWLAYGVLVGVVLQGVVGGVSVRLDLHPGIVGSHFLLSGALLVLSTLLAVRWFEGDGARRLLGGRTLRSVAAVVALLAVLVVVLGVVVTGAGPHSGDDEVGYRFAVDPYLVARMHAAAVWLLLVTQVALLVAAARTRPVLPALRRWSLVLLAVTLAQGLIGYVQFFTGLPELLVGAHMLGAALLIVATTRTVLTLRTREPEVVEQPRRPAAATAD